MSALAKIRHRAKQIRHKNEAWTDAISRASKQLKREGKIGATKFIDKGETKRSRTTKTYMRKRNKRGQFGGYKRVGNVNTKSATHTDKNKIHVDMQIGSIAHHKAAIARKLKNNLGNALVQREMAKTKTKKKQLTKKIRSIKSDLRSFC